MNIGGQELRRKRVICVLKWLGIITAAVLVAIALTCSMSIDQFYISKKGLEDYTRLERFLTHFYRSLDHDRTRTGALALLGGALVYFLPRLKSSFQEKALAVVFGGLFSVMQVLGRSYSDTNSWDEICKDHFTVFRALVILLGFWILGSCLVLYLFRLADKLSRTEVEPGRTFQKRKLLIGAGVILLCWLPAFLLFFPGMGTADTSGQIATFYHENTPYQSVSAVQADDIFITNHHPFLTTAMYGGAIRLGELLGDTRYGVGLYIAVQMVLLSLVMSAAWTYLYGRGCSNRVYWAGILFSGLFPLYQFHAISMVKDVTFSGLALLYALLMLVVCDTGGEALNHPRFCVGLFVDGLLVTLTRNQGAYILLIIGAVCLVVFRRRWKQVIATVLVPALLFQLVWLNLLLPVFHVAPGGKQEAIGFLFQQTARYVVEYPEDVTNEQAEAIRAVLDYDQLKELYNPVLSDPVKYTYHQDATREEMSAYYHVWFEMLLKHPDSYVQAILNNCYGFFYVDQQADLFYRRWRNFSDDSKPYFVAINQRTADAKNMLNLYHGMIQALPLFGLVASVSTGAWAILFLFLDAIRKKKYLYLIPQLFSIISVGVYLVSPANANGRYIMPVLYMAPVLAGLALVLGRVDAPKKQETTKESV